MMWHYGNFFYMFLLTFLLFTLQLGYSEDVLPDQENWFLISSRELQRLEQISTNWERDRLNWLLQVRELKADSVNSNDLLRQERELTQNLRTSFSEYEAGQSILVSSKNGEIAGLKDGLAAEKLKTQKVRTLNIILGGILAAIVVIFAVKIYLKIQTGGMGWLSKLLR